jgi:hypothetical protein
MSGVNVVYPQIDRIARVAFEVVRKRGGKLCSADKANMLEVLYYYIFMPNIIRNVFCRICLYGQLVLKVEPRHGVIFKTPGYLEFLLFYLGHIVDTT